MGTPLELSRQYASFDMQQVYTSFHMEKNTKFANIFVFSYSISLKILKMPYIKLS
jgi:hypothetical protein